MNEISFLKTGNTVSVNIIDQEEFKRASEAGILQLFDIETDIGGFRFIHSIDLDNKIRYLVLYFKNYVGSVTVYELPLQDFHNFVSYWILQNNLDAGQTMMPEGNIPGPLDNLRYCMQEMVARS